MLIANKPCRAIQTFYQLFSPIAWYDTVLDITQNALSDKCECITGSFSVWVSVWHSDRVQDLHGAPFVWCWCLSLPLRAPGLLSAPLMPVELYYIKICNKNNIPAITAGGVVQSDALITKQCWTRTHQSLWLMHACYLWSGVRCLHHVHIQAWQRQSAELFASEIPSRLEPMLSGVECTMGDVQGKHDSWLTGQTAAAGREQNGSFPWRLVAGFGVYLRLPGQMFSIFLP